MRFQLLGCPLRDSSVLLALALRWPRFSFAATLADFSSLLIAQVDLMFFCGLALILPPLLSHIAPMVVVYIW